MTRDTAILLAPHAARLHALLPAGQPLTAVLVILALLALCAGAAYAVRLEGQR